MCVDKTALLDYLVGASEQRGWHVKAKRLCGLEVDHQFSPRSGNAMDDDTVMLGAGYGLAALSLQMALLNSLAGQGGVPKQAIERVIERAKAATNLVADDETPAEMIQYAQAAMDRVAENWATMQVRH
jgi:hypothetical protein